MAKGKKHPSEAAAGDEMHEPAFAEGFVGDGPPPDDAGGLTRDDVTAEGLIPSGAPTDAGATPVSLPPGIPTDADRVARLEADIAEMRALLRTSAAAGTLAPPGYRLVPDVPSQDAKSLAEQEAIKAEIDKGNRRRTQEEADRRFPEGKHVWRCVLAADKNGHPELLIRAANQTDAAARYLAACGINHTEHRVQVDRV